MPVIPGRKAPADYDRICTGSVIWWNASSTRSSNSPRWTPDTWASCISPPLLATVKCQQNLALARTNEGSEPVRLMLTWWRAEVDVCGILGWSASRNASPSAAGTETDLQSDL